MPRRTYKSVVIYVVTANSYEDAIIVTARRNKALAELEAERLTALLEQAKRRNEKVRLNDTTVLNYEVVQTNLLEEFLPIYG